MIKKNQSIIILGELGAGKSNNSFNYDDYLSFICHLRKTTETSKCVLQYLTESYGGGNDLMKERFIKCKF